MNKNTQNPDGPVVDGATNQDAFEAMLEEKFGERSRYGGYEVFGTDGSLADPPEPSISIDHYYGSAEYSFVHFDADGEKVAIYTVELEHPTLPARPAVERPQAA